MQTTRIGIVGCGAIAEKHGQALANLDWATISAVADTQPDRAQGFVGRYVSDPADVYIGSDYREMLQKPEVDVVIVSAPSGLHYQIGYDALCAKKHVLMEKPLTLCSEEAEELVAAASENNIYLGTVHPNRCYPSIQMAHHALQAGRLGRLSHIVATLRWNRTQAYYDEAPWRKTRSMDGGVLFNQAWHILDLMLWFAANPVASVCGLSACRLHQIETEDVALGAIRFGDGTLGIVEATTNVYPRNMEQTLSVFGATGTVVIGGNRADAIRTWKVAGDEEHDVLAQWGEANAPKQSASWPHEQCIGSFLAAVRDGKTGPSPEALSAVGVIELIERILRLD